ncbi:MAG: gliding motility-associated C-terminal domain-containing protein, partial [Cyclobacteriaceae bacterium]
YDPLTDGNWRFRWFAPDGSEIAVNNPGRNILPLNRGNNPPGVYRVEVENRSDPTLCPGSREVTVNYGNPFTVDIATVEPDNSCETGERQLTVNFDDPDAANLDLIYSWRLNGVEIGASRTVTVTESGSYEVRVRERNSACFSNDELPVDVSEPLNVNVIFGNTCADGSAIPLFAAVNVSDTTLSYSWFNPQGDRIPAANTRGDSLFVESDMAEGQYRVEVSSTTGCTAQGTATIRRNPQPEVELGPSRTICTQDPDPEINSVELEVGTATEIYWNTPKGEFFNTTTVIADVPGTYTVELTNQFGCVTTDSVEVVDDCHPRIVAPNAFRPGGVNNEFFVYSRYVASEDFEVKIYNRWGELIYYSTSPDFRWDGTYKGKPAPLGTYPYVINYRSSTSGDSGEILEERGGITIVR